MKTKVLEIRTLRLDKNGGQTKKYDKGNKLRFSVYFDYEKDNHHVQFPERAERHIVATLLRELSDRIMGVGTP